VGIPLLVQGEETNLPPWYFPGLNTEQCLQALRSAEGGVFIVRKEPKMGHLLLSVVKNGRVFHHQLVEMGGFGRE